MITSFTILQQGATYTFFWQPDVPPAGAGSHACWAITSLRPHQQGELQAAIDAAAELAGQLGLSTGADIGALLRLGRLLFGHVLPLPLQELIRRLPPGSPLAICTNDTELPWELLHDDHDFLALRHVVSRQLLAPGSARPSPAVIRPHAPHSLHCLLIGNPNGDLPGADAEVESLLDLMETAAQEVSVEFLCREHAAKVRVLAALAGGEYDLIHFACHARPGAVRLADGWLEAAEIQAVLRGQPLVVLNACSSSRTRGGNFPALAHAEPAPPLSGVHSLAQSFLVGGAPVFLGAAWPVEDGEIRRLALEFYRALLGGQPLGAALRQARHASRRRSAPTTPAGHTDPPGRMGRAGAAPTLAWAAPVLYGDPGYRLPGPAIQRQPGTILSVRLAAHQEFAEGESLEGYARRAQQLAGELLAIAQGHGGEVTLVRPDALRVLFGVPVPVEDDAVRALRAALEIRTAVARRTAPGPADSSGLGSADAPSQGCSIAVTSGEIATVALPTVSAAGGHGVGLSPGTGHGPVLYLGPLFGEADTLLRQSQPGQVLANERARQLAQGRFAFASRLVEAEHDTVLCYEIVAGGEGELLAAAAGDRREPDEFPGLPRGRLLGRDRELDLLAAWWQAAAQGRGLVVGVVGEAGVGKTRLLEEFRRTLDPASHAWIGLACSSTGRDTPYSLVAQLLRQIFGILPSDGGEAAAVKIEQGLAALPGSPHAADPQINQILRETLGLSTSHVAEDERKARRGRLVNLLRTMMANVAQQQPLVIAVDDLHWVDEASFDLLAQVTDGIQRLGVQFVVLYRPEWQHGWFDKAYYRHLPLDQLDQDAAYDLLRALLGGELPKGLGVLLQKTGGNPFFIEEMVKSLQESGILVRRRAPGDARTAAAAWPVGGTGAAGAVSAGGVSAGWELSRPLTEQQLPGTVARTLRVRLAALTAPARTVLETAAVIGPRFGLPLLRQLLLDALAEPLDTALAELERRGFVEASWDVEEYRFRHALILDAVGQTMAPNQRQAWHRRIAEVLAAQGAEVETLAHHLYQGLLASRPAEPPKLDSQSSAAQVEQAVACLLACGERSLLRYAAREAITYYQRVLLLTSLLSSLDMLPGTLPGTTLLSPLLSLCDDAEVRSHEGIGDALTLLGSFDAAYAALRQAYAALHRQPLDPSACRRAADLARRIGRSCAWPGEHALALSWMAEGLRALGEPQDDEDRAVAALLHVHKGTVEYNRGSLEEVARLCARGLDLARAVGVLLPAEAEAHNMLGIIAWAGGHIPEALAHYEQSRGGWLALGNSYQVARVEGNMGVAYFYLAQWEQARLYHTRCKEYWEQIEDRDMLAHPCLNLGNIYLYQGNWEEAERHFSRALALWSSAHHERFMSLGHTNLGLLAIEQGEWAKAQAQLEESYAILTGANIRDLLWEVLAARAEVALGLGDLSQAAALAAEAQAGAAALAMQHEEALARRVLGRVHLAQAAAAAPPAPERAADNNAGLGSADLATARRELCAALATFAAMDNRYEAARTLYYLAQVELAADCHAAAAEALQTAQASFTALGAHHDRALAERLQDDVLSVSM